MAGSCRLRSRATPANVPPVPTNSQNASMSPPACSQISEAVPSSCAAAFPSRWKWSARNAPRSRAMLDAASSTKARSSPETWPATEPARCSTRTTSAPSAHIIVARSSELPADMTATKGWPVTPHTIANPVPVLPLVSSTTGCPGSSAPLASASRIIRGAIRSFFDPPGLRYSSLARIRPSSPRVIRESSTSGVPPTADRTDGPTIDLASKISCTASPPAVAPGAGNPNAGSVPAGETSPSVTSWCTRSWRSPGRAASGSSSRSRTRGSRREPSRVRPPSRLASRDR